MSQFVKLAITMLIMHAYAIHVHHAYAGQFSKFRSVPADRLFHACTIKNDCWNTLGEQHVKNSDRQFPSWWRNLIDGFSYDKALDIFLDAEARRGLTAEAMKKKITASVAFDFDSEILNKVYADDSLDDSALCIILHLPKWQTIY